MNRPNEKKKKRSNLALKAARRGHHRRKRHFVLDQGNFDRLRKEVQGRVFLDGQTKVDLPAHVAESACDMALLMILKGLGLRSSSVLDLMCGMLPKLMQSYGIEKLPVTLSEPK
jgi:hypothetical protein